MTSSKKAYELQWELEVVDQVRALPRELHEPIIRRCGALCDEPRPPGFEKLDASYRIRFRGVLVWYWVDDANRLVIVVRIVPDPSGLFAK